MRGEGRERNGSILWVEGLKFELGNLGIWGVGSVVFCEKAFDAGVEICLFWMDNYTMFVDYINYMWLDNRGIR